MNCPECDELKATYDKCLKDYVKKWDFSLASVNGTNQCEKPFQDYKGCVEISMKLKIERRKQG